MTMHDYIITLDANTGRADNSAAIRLCHCHECIHGAVTAVLEKKDGNVKEFWVRIR